MKRIAHKNSMDAVHGGSNHQNENVSTPKKKDESSISIERDGLGNVIIDTVAAAEEEPSNNKKAKKKQVAKKKGQPKKKKDDDFKPISSNQSLSKVQPKVSPSSTTTTDNDEDYAIKMARQQAALLMKTVTAGTITSSTKGTVSISGGESDYAILAAKNAAAARRKILKNNEEETLANSSRMMEGKDIPSIKGQESSSSPPSTNKKVVIQKKKKKANKVQDLSNDEMFLKLNDIANKAKESSWERTIPKRKVGDNTNSLVDGLSSAKSTIARTNENVVATEKKTDDEIQADILQIAKQNEKVQAELRAATDMMPIERDDGSESLSPEELLAKVLKFGDAKEKEESPGYGFVEGAFGKARELLQAEVPVAKSVNNALNFKEDEQLSSDEMKRRLEEEELRRIFAAGQSVVENRLANPPPTSQPSNLVKPSITDEDINELINADETVPRNARVLDDELAELEVRMSKSQEGKDVIGSNPTFDPFSGPETYNPNVDPETAVNWPGAKEGTRTDVKLAADLSNALKQAQFASAVLSQMREEKVDDNNNDNGEVRYFVGKKELSSERVILLRTCVDEAVKAGLVVNPEVLEVERSRLQMLIDELISQPEERLEEISMNYKDILLSDNLIDLVKERLYFMAQRDVEAQREGNEHLVKERHASERAILINLTQISQALVKEAQALGAELEVSMLEIIRSICEVAMDPRHKTEEETTVALTDAVRDMRPLLDDAFVAYLKYAISEEEGKLARAGVLDDPEHNRWLFVLKIVQEGVYTELSQGVKRYIDHIWYVLRMKSKSERKELLAKLIDVMPTMDVRPFVKVVNNIVGSLGTTVKGDFSDGVILGDMTNELLQLQRDVGELLPPDRINELSKDADAWAATQREKLLERRNLTRQRLEAARVTGDIDVDKVIKPGAEAERFD